MKHLVVFLLALIAIGACVREQDLAAWRGVPVSALDRHPFFLTLPVEVRRLPDGTEIRNYVNGGNLASCFGNASGNAYGSRTTYVTGSSFCSSRFAVCNNIFYIKNGRVQSYVPTPSGGARCMTDGRVTPKSY